MSINSKEGWIYITFSGHDVINLDFKNKLQYKTAIALKKNSNISLKQLLHQCTNKPKSEEHLE